MDTRETDAVGLTRLRQVKERTSHDTGQTLTTTTLYLGSLQRIHTNAPADPHVQSPDTPQNFNRYAYVLNNPLSYTDPSGYFFKKLFRSIKKVFKKIHRAIKKVSRWIKENWRTVVVIAIGVVLSFVSYGTLSGVALAMVKGAVAGAANSALHGGDFGDILRGAVIGGITGAATGALHGVGNWARGIEHVPGFEIHHSLTAGQQIFRGSLYVAGHGIVGGARSAAMGGKFKDGFFGAAAGAMSGFIPGVDNLSGAGKFAVHVVAGGTASAAGGGKFANGAFTAAFHYLFNEAAVSVKGGLSKVLNQKDPKSCSAVAACNLHKTLTGESITEEDMIKLWKKHNGGDLTKYGGNEQSLLGPLNELGKKHGITYKYETYNNQNMLRTYASKNVPVLIGINGNGFGDVPQVVKTGVAGW